MISICNQFFRGLGTTVPQYKTCSAWPSRKKTHRASPFVSPNRYSEFDTMAEMWSLLYFLFGGFYKPFRWALVCKMSTMSAASSLERTSLTPSQAMMRCVSSAMKQEPRKYPIWMTSRLYSHCLFLGRYAQKFPHAAV